MFQDEYVLMRVTVPQALHNITSTHIQPHTQQTNKLRVTAVIVATLPFK